MYQCDGRFVWTRWWRYGTNRSGGGFSSVIAAGERDGWTTDIIRGDGLEDSLEVSPDDVFRNRNHRLIADGGLAHELDETVGIGIRQGFEEHLVDHRKDCGVGADAEGEGEDGGPGEAG